MIFLNSLTIIEDGVGLNIKHIYVARVVHSFLKNQETFCVKKKHWVGKHFLGNSFVGKLFVSAPKKNNITKKEQKSPILSKGQGVT